MDYGPGIAPRPAALALQTPGRAAWIIAAEWNRDDGHTSVQLGIDDLLVVFDEKFVGALGLLDKDRGLRE